MNAQAYEGYFENGCFFTAGQAVKIPEHRRVYITVLDEPTVGLDLQKRPKDPILARGWDAMRAIQEESIKNGTDKMTMEEIDALIAESRRERRANK